MLNKYLIRSKFVSSYNCKFNYEKGVSSSCLILNKGDFGIKEDILCDFSIRGKRFSHMDCVSEAILTDGSFEDFYKKINSYLSLKNQKIIMSCYDLVRCQISILSKDPIRIKIFEIYKELYCTDRVSMIKTLVELVPYEEPNKKRKKRSIFNKILKGLTSKTK